MPSASTSSFVEDEVVSDERAAQVRVLRDAIDAAVHYLPTQGPISVFVHHNTLHCLEDQSFDDAVVRGAGMYGCEPYLSEDRYRDELARGRIRMDDLETSLMSDSRSDELIAHFGTRYSLRMAMMRMHLHMAPDAELRWLLAETDLLQRFRDEVPAQQREQTIAATWEWLESGIRPAGCRESEGRASQLPEWVLDRIRQQGGTGIARWTDRQREAFSLQVLWRVCEHGVQLIPAAGGGPAWPLRDRDLLLRATGEDSDSLVHEVLIPVCAAYLDQGFSAWELPDRERGFAYAFAAIHHARLAIHPRWMRELVKSPEFEAIKRGQFDALNCLAESLAALGIPQSQWAIYLRQSLLALRGWAGMIWQLETQTPWAPKQAPAGSLNEFLAVQLLLERYAVCDIGRKHWGLANVQEIRRRARAQVSERRQRGTEQRTYLVFQIAQARGWTPQQLLAMTAPQWARLLDEIESFSSVERRRIFHHAYERRYRVDALDAVAAHAARRKEVLDAGRCTPDYLAVFCIDDREESFRRHLEEVDPGCQTASAAGFYAVAMYYRGVNEAHYRPLCPNVITPVHYVREEPLFSKTVSSERIATRRRQLGRLTHQVHAGSRTLVGGWLTGVFGGLATFPLVARILAPRLTSKMRELVGSWVRSTETELRFERLADAPGPEPEALGFSLDEMAQIVTRVLQDMGWVDHLPPIILFLGHGSSSLNNPHESAYNCGACSGGRGGPNARTFALMANDPRVRRKVAAQGIVIPDEVRFLGGYHNTCNDRVEYYDLDLLPQSHRTLFRRIERSVNDTRARNAHERCRRFESASLSMSPQAALEHVEQRAEDLSQTRPEYNHATNALVVVGRRDWSRGLFLDRRAFLTSYDPAVDDEQGTILGRILQAAIPVCAGISLEYYFSTVDTEGYGCGSKLPHNIASMLGVMTGAASDLRPGLSQQMVEIHEPMRILFIVETTPDVMLAIIERSPVIARLVRGEWVQLAVIDPRTSAIQEFRDGEFRPYQPRSCDLPQVDSSRQWYQQRREHLGFVSVMEPQELSARRSASSTSKGEVTY